MRMQVILDSSFARPGSVPIWGGKKVEFRDWTTFRCIIFRLEILPASEFRMDIFIEAAVQEL